MNKKSSNLSPAKKALLEKWKGGKFKAQTIPKRPDSDFVPLSSSQQRLWFIDQLYNGSPFYNIPCALHLKGTLNVTALQQSLNEILRRHEGWRTTFAIVDGQPMQAIAPELSWELAKVNLEHLSGQDWEREVHLLATSEAKKPFDLTQGPLVRATLLRISEKEHIFLLTMHHIVSDGWSIGVFLKELATLYAAFSTGQPSPLPELPIHYPDFAVWQQENLPGEQIETQLNYWKQQLGGELPVLRLPADRPRPAVATFNGAKQYFRFPKTLTEALNKLSQQEEVSLYMILLAAFNTLLYRYTEQEDIPIGSPIANRNRPELEGILGFFVNTLVMRTDLSGNPSFRTLLSRVREVTLDSYANQDLPFEKLVEELQPKRDDRFNPLFQVMFVLQNAPIPVREVAGLTLRTLEIDSGTAMLDLSVSIAESEQGLTGFWEYNTDLFDSATIARWSGNFQTLLSSIVADPNQHISELPILTAKEREQLLVEWNDTHQDYPENASLHQLFEQQVEKSPDALALIDGAEQITYRQLNQKANQLAHYLQKLGVTTETLVAICLERSVEMVVGVLAIFKAGGAYIPLDPNYPSSRLAFMLSDSQASVLLTKQEILEKLSESLEGESTAKTVCLDTCQDSIARECQENPVSKSSADNLAYVLYTSGSTGTPKGVLGTHRGTVNGLNWMWKTYPPQGVEICCHKTAISFGDSIWEIFGPLLQGLQAVIIPDAIVKDTRLFIETLARHQVTRIMLVPSLLGVMLDTYRDLTKKLSKLKIWITSGEPLALDLTQTFRQLMPSAKLLNFYGLSEVSANVICYDTSCLPEKANSVFIGRPIDNTQVYVLDRHQQPTPIGVFGELYIGGVPLARSYLHRPELNQKHFLDNPFLPGTKLYKTGDLVRYRNDGNLEYLGRGDDRVKIRGFRIELGEIEAAIAKHPDVKETAVIAREDDRGERRLIAYVVTDADNIVPKLRSYLRKNLPDYMVPSAFAVLDAFPLTPSGKVDKRSLPTKDLIRANSTESFVPPRDTWEFALVQIWENLLNISSIGVTDDFFELGGHSLLAARLIAQINERFGQKLPLSILFQGATIENLAKVLQQQIGSNSDSPLVPIRSSGSRIPLFCVHPAGGNIITYPNLASKLDAEQPFYALEQSPIQQEPEIISVEETATHYIEEIRAVQPKGPYLLAGWCYGGLIAFEMAQQLQRQGEKIALLAVFDAIIPETKPQPTKDDDAKFIIRSAEALKYLFGIDLSVSYNEISHLTPEEQFNLLMKKANIVSNTEIQQHFRYYQLFKAHVQAMRDYVLQVYTNEITLFRAREEIPHDFQSAELYSDDPFLGWSKYSEQPIKVIEVPGNHFSMFAEPHIQELGQQLKICLDEVFTNQQKS
ncbi:non-ribosomal peptide synthetase [Oscillatoria salina]|uniref:non-ribosomal peptide synthetase n=1 Tax=Oscillatoria salina TaxID=331517 RepID=UPI001CCA5CB3|nr:non-ribosomal peptide synthetase [Oscillatoria salina]MBZ8180967.1 amino acid adenylation domain-containing protein [Oscillatoria salina IIICB1]